MKSEFAVEIPCELCVNALIVDQRHNKNRIICTYEVSSEEPTEWSYDSFGDKWRLLCGDSFVAVVTVD